MADRYWVGGTAAWDATAGTKWAATSGGAGGQSVPTAADNVFFDAASGVVTCTVAATANCLSLNFTGFTGTFTGAFQLNVFGSLTVVSGMTWTHTTTLSFSGSGAATFTSGGKTFGEILISGGAAQSVTLQDALTVSGLITLSLGTFTTNNYAVTSSGLVSSNSSTRTINLGSSTVTLTSGTAINFFTNTGLTFNAGTSTIIVTNPLATITTASSPSAPGVTFHNVSLASTTIAIRAVAGANTFNNLTVTAPTSVGVVQVTFDSRQTINGTLSTTGTAGNRRVWFRSNTYGLAQTLTINSAPSLTDADFRDIYVIGTAAPISGTRIGDLRGCSGITFSTPKTVYWVNGVSEQWTTNSWSSTDAGAASTDFFPLPQDTATFTNTRPFSGQTVSTDTLITALPTVDMSARTNAMTLSISGAQQFCYGDWKNGSGTIIFNGNTLTFSGRKTQTITSAGKTFTCPITIDSYGGTVELVDALNIGIGTFTVTNGTFDTKNYNVTAGQLLSNNSNVRAITMGSSTITLSSNSPVVFTTSTNLTLNAGTSTIVCTSLSASFIGGKQTFYNISFSNSNSGTRSIIGENTFNNLNIVGTSSAGLVQCTFAANQTINGTLTVAGDTAVRRVFLRSDTLGTPRTLTVNSLSAQDCDFRDITIAGAAAGSSPTRAGNCGGNTGITFPAAKTVYWNLAGTQNWSATGWASSSGGTPDINQFPLAQDTAVFDDTGSVTGTITINAAWNLGTFDASLRTSAMTLNVGTTVPLYGDWKFGTGVTSGAGGTIQFATRSTQTIISNGRTFNCQLDVSSATGVTQLGDALAASSGIQLAVNSGTFDAVTYNVTVGAVQAGGTSTLKMGTGTWTLSGTSPWFVGSSVVFYKGTANIVLSDTSTSARSFTGGGFSYNKLTIGGATGTSTTTISGNNQFTELASTKTVAHTIALGTTVQTFGTWTVTGTAGNVVSFTGTGTNHVIAGARVSGVDYLAFGSIGFSGTSPGEFYAGFNSSATTPNIFLRTAPAPVTRYWRGGTGTWGTSTANWSATSGGPGGATVPTSVDTVIFDAASNATAYTVTCTATQLRCGSLTMDGPASGNLTWSGTAPIAIHNNFTLPATGLTRTYTGTITLSGSATGRTFTTNGVSLGSNMIIDGVGCGWSLGSALTTSGSVITVINGSFNLATYNLITGAIDSQYANSRTINFSTGTITFTFSGAINFSSTEVNRANLTFVAGTSQINISNSGATLTGNNQTFYNVAFTSGGTGTVNINGANTFNNLSFAGVTVAGLKNISFTANQTINGTLTLSAGTNATMRQFVRSDTFGTTRTLTCAAFSGTDADFRDITVAGAAAPVSGTRLGDCKGNSGITFPAAKTVYWREAAANWSSVAAWSATDNGTADITQFPLAQDTAVFQTYPPSGSTVIVNFSYNIGTINMSARTSNTMTLATALTTPQIYGNWINGTGTTLSGTGVMTFAGRGNQTITSAGVTFTQSFNIDTPSGSVTLQDAFSNNRSSSLGFVVSKGTFDANNYNVSLTGNLSSVSTTGTEPKTIAVGSGTWTLIGATPWNALASTGLTVTGTGTISLTSASAKTFVGGGVSYSGITLNQGGAGTLTITGNNTFANISNTYKATGATNITLGNTTQTVGNFTASGEAGRLLTVQGTSASSPATLVLTGGTVTTPDYLTITGVRAYNLKDTWYAGANSINNGSLGWIFASATVVVNSILSNFFLFF